MAEAKMTILTNMCMVRNEGKLLMQIRNDKNWGGAVFPGGHVEDGESITASVIREVREETGLTVVSPKLCGIKDFYTREGYRYVVFLYYADRFDGEIRSSDEGEVMWVDENELDRLETVRGFDELYRMYCDADSTELWYHDGGFDII